MAYGQSNFLSTISSANGQQQSANSGYLIARVSHVIYGPYYPGTTISDPNYNDPTDLGKILYQIINGTQTATATSSGNRPAKPFYSWMKQYPTEGEFVYLVAGPSLALNENTDQKDYYYLPPFNLWGSVHHNALPNLLDYGEYVNSTNKDYQQSRLTNQPNNQTTGSIQYPLGDGFYEKPNIKNLEMFVGDIAFEGRYGTSIRFGTSLKTNKDKNYWWDGPEGNPITIIRNGQGKQIDQEGWIPTVENINRDPSSIYLTNGQVVEIVDINKNFPLTTLGVTLQADLVANVIPLNQQLTSLDSLSANTQDVRINNQNPNVIR